MNHPPMNHLRLQKIRLTPQPHSVYVEHVRELLESSPVEVAALLAIRQGRLVDSWQYTDNDPGKVTLDFDEIRRRVREAKADGCWKAHNQCSTPCGITDVLTLLVENEAARRRLEAEIATLAPQLPAMDREIAELEGEILPRLAREQASAEHEVRLEVFRANSATADTMTQVPHALLARWNTGVSELVAMLGELAAFNGRVEWWSSSLSNEARNLKVDDLPRLPEPLPLDDLLQTLRAALREAWRDGRERGEAEAGQAYLSQPGMGGDA